MTYGKKSNNDGVLTLSPDENAAFLAGKPVTKKSGDSRGHFTITLKLTRPRSKAKRFAGL